MTSPSPLTPAQAGAQPSPHGTGPGLRRGERGRGDLAALAYALAAAVIVLDQLSKAWVLSGLHLPERGQVQVLPPLFNLTFVWNQSMSFGLIRGRPDVVRWGLTAFSALVALALAVWARRVDRRLTAVAIGLLIGGAVGNLIDRARFGAVVDFLDFAGLHFPWVFNLADSAINVGVAVLLLDSLLQPKPPRT